MNNFQRSLSQSRLRRESSLKSRVSMSVQNGMWEYDVVSTRGASAPDADHKLSVLFYVSSNIAQVIVFEASGRELYADTSHDVQTSKLRLSRRLDRRLGKESWELVNPRQVD